jgi:NADPH-dependent ferric siderophore reductase
MSRPFRRPPPRRTEVVSVARLTPRLVSVQLGGDALAGFRIEAPTQHIKVFVPAEGTRELVLPERGPDGPVFPDGAPRPQMRTYTPRAFDEATGLLEVQFVLHGEGPASAWAERAERGDQVGIGGPGGRFRLDPEVPRWWIGGDESAIPGTPAEVHLEVDGPADEVPLPQADGATITWHHRTGEGTWGQPIEDALRAGAPGYGTHIWVACEAQAVRTIRRHLLQERGLPAATVTTRGYWRQGEVNHPDHDYGED